MSKHEQVILIIEDYIFDITEPQRNWDKHWFKEVSYQRWAGNELLNRVRRNPEKDPIDIISDIAYEMATDILEIIRCLN